ncbi:MAG TPA: hypothetical protein VLH86_06100 [Patescibacteria group bacterium]|nr:hypothetical protein [Patescibacteria group bacterium]
MAEAEPLPIIPGAVDPATGVPLLPLGDVETQPVPPPETVGPVSAVGLPIIDKPELQTDLLGTGQLFAPVDSLRNRLILGASRLLPEARAERFRAGRLAFTALGRAALAGVVEVELPTDPDAAPAPAAAPTTEADASSEERLVIEALERLETLQTDAGGVMAANLKRSLVPLIMSMVGEPARREQMLSVLANAERHVLTADKLEAEQRVLNPQERQYMEQYGELTAANPWLAAAAEIPEATNVWLDSYFDNMDRQTQFELPSGSYVPIIVNGGGLAGLINMAVLLAKRPDLVGQVMLADGGEFLGGVFGSPNGRAWLLNSKKLVGSNYFELPDDSTRDFDTKVRGLLGGIFRWYPGERNDDPAQARSGSINRLGDLWLPPDVIGENNYNDNFELAVMIKMQMALALSKYQKNLTLKSVEVNGDAGTRGTYKLSYTRTTTEGVSEDVIYYTDCPALPVGPGEFATNLTVDEKFTDVVTAGIAKDGMPYYMNGGQFYRYAADRAQGPIEHGTRWMVGGIGDTGITVAEILGRIFKTTNLHKITAENASSIDTIYLVASKDQSLRGRYAGSFDLRTRELINNVNAQLEGLTGRANILQIIGGRAGSLEFVSGSKNLQVRYEDGSVLLDPRSKKPAVVDHYVECVGVEPSLEPVLEPLLAQLGNATLGQLLNTVTLPNNPGVPVAQTIRGNREIHVTGTATGNLYNANKEAVVPPGTRVVLRDVMANRVSIGLQGPDIQAGTSLYVENIVDAVFPPISLAPAPAPEVFDVTREMAGPMTMDLGGAPTLRRDRFVNLESGLLMTLLLGQVADGRISTADRRAIDAHIAIKGNQVTISQPRRGADDAGMPLGLARKLAGSAMNTAVKAYLEEAIRTRRGATGIDVHMVYEDGQLKLEESFALAS